MTKSQTRMIEVALAGIYAQHFSRSWGTLDRDRHRFAVGSRTTPTGTKAGGAGVRTYPPSDVARLSGVTLDQGAGGKNGLGPPEQMTCGHYEVQSGYFDRLSVLIDSKSYDQTA